MKEEIQFRLIGNGHADEKICSSVPMDLIEELLRGWPDLVIQDPEGGVRIKLDLFSSQGREIIKLIELRSGRAPRLSKKNSDAMVYRVSGAREFSLDDMSQHEYFCFIPRLDFAKDCAYSEEGVCEIKKKDLKDNLNKLTIGRGIFFDALVSNALKMEIEASLFAGVAFLPVTIIGGRGEISEPVWKLNSTQVMPPLKNDIVDADGELLGSRFGPGAFIEDVIFPPILRFSKSLVGELGDFDIAVTHESLGTGYDFMRRQPWLICSRRFRSWLTEKKMPVNFYPICLD